MNVLRIALQIAILYGFYRIGLLVQYYTNLPIPGSVIGMLILFILLLLGIVKENMLKSGASTLLLYMPLLFIPATVGVMDHFSFFASSGIFAAIAVLISTFLVMIIAGRLGQKIATFKEKKTNQSEERLSKEEETA